MKQAEEKEKRSCFHFKKYCECHKNQLLQKERERIIRFCIKNLKPSMDEEIVYNNIMFKLKEVKE